MPVIASFNRQQLGTKWKYKPEVPTPTWQKPELLRLPTGQGVYYEPGQSAMLSFVIFYKPLTKKQRLWKSLASFSVWSASVQFPTSDHAGIPFVIRLIIILARLWVINRAPISTPIHLYYPAPRRHFSEINVMLVMMTIETDCQYRSRPLRIQHKILFMIAILQFYLSAV